MSDYRDFEIKFKGNVGLSHIETKEGELPAQLQGYFTSASQAMKAIDEYELTKPVVTKKVETKTEAK